MLGMGCLLCDDVVSLYTAMFDSIGGRTPQTEGVGVAAILVLVCQHQLAVACLSSMQGRMSDSAMQTRRAIEGCAIARICLEDDSAAKSWLESPLHDRKDVRTRFSAKKLFPEGCAGLAELGTRFDTCSAITHASLHSISTAFLAMDPDNEGLGFRHFEVVHPSEIITRYLWVIDTHIQILRVFERMFTAHLDDRWRKECDDVAERVDRHKARHAPTVQSAQQWRRDKFRPRDGAC